MRSSAPRVGLQARAAVLRAVEAEEVLDEERDVLAALAQRRRGDGDDVEAVVEVLAEAPARCTSARRSRLVAATMRTSTCDRCCRRRGSNSPSWSTRSSFTCTAGDSSPISSRKSVPAGGLREAPVASCAIGAGERAALVAEELALEERLRDRRAVDGDERALARARSRSWMERATSSLPVPLSPRTSTVARLGAACVATSTTRRNAGELPTISRCVSSLISSFERPVLGDELLPLRRLAHALHDGHAA